MAAPASDRRRILCTSCEAPLEIATEAKSVNCQHCNNRVVTEAVTVKGYMAVRKFQVANRIHITRKGIVYAAVRADDLRVDGFLQGDALALGRLHLGKKARVKGDVRASYLIVEKGAQLVGDVRVGPGQVHELQNLLAGEFPPQPEPQP